MHAYYVHLHDENQRLVTSTGKTDNAFEFWADMADFAELKISTILLKSLNS